MEVNWFTVIAQIINFLILVWLLKRFLYKPVLNAIDEREKKISAQLNDAAAQKTEAKKEHDEFLRKKEQFDKERSVKMNEVLEEIELEKLRLLEEVRIESNALRSKYEESLKEQEGNIISNLKRKTKDEVFAIASKTLGDLANTNLEEQAVKTFIKKVRGLSDDKNAQLMEAFGNNDKKITIKSAFELTDLSRTELEKVIKEITGKQNIFQYEVVPDLLSGIEIAGNSHQLSWNIESYLNSLKENITSKEKENAIH